MSEFQSNPPSHETSVDDHDEGIVKRIYEDYFGKLGAGSVEAEFDRDEVLGCMILELEESGLNNPELIMIKLGYLGENI